ncbi:GumC family protein [Tsuneonella sp. HG249]
MNYHALDDEQLTEGPATGKFLSQLPVVLAERKWWIVGPALIGLLAALATAFLMPSKYESAAVLLVQAPSLPPEVIGVSGNDAVAQRIEAIRQRLINRPALIAMIERNGLYAQERKRTPLSEIVEDMREAIALEPQTVDLGPSTTADKTISVRLAFEYGDPVLAQAVAQQLMERVVEVDSTTNAEQQTETVQFLSDQQQELQTRIARAEGDLAAFNTRNGRVMASGSLATIGGGSGAFDLQISNLEREIAELQGQKRLQQSAETRDPAVVQAEGALAAARAVFAESHPDVVLAKQRLEQAKQFAKQNVARVPSGAIDERIRLARSQIVELQVAKQREFAQAASVMAQRAQAPAVEQQAAQLQQRIETLYKQAEEISGRLLAARAAARADQEQMGERLLVVDPPVVPDTPIWPDRPLVIGIGALGGLALGFFLAFGIEILLRPIRDPAALAKITGSRPLATIPVFVPQGGDARRGARSRSGGWLSVLRRRLSSQGR